MADYTPQYKLQKPLPEEFYDVEVQNGNMDKIEAALTEHDKSLRKKADLDASGKIKASQMPSDFPLDHAKASVAGEEGVHGLRYYNKQFQIKNGDAWEGISGIGGKIELASIAITDPPTKTSYLLGESFDPTGMVVTATYTDGNTTQVTGYTTSPVSFTALGYQNVTVSYTETGVTVSSIMSVIVERIPIANLPSQNGTLNYIGSPQSPIWNNYNPDMLILGGVTTGTDAGSYTTTFTPKEGYRWADNTTDAKPVTWSIGRAVVPAEPFQSGTFIYTGSAQSPTWLNYNTAQLTIGGATSATDAGTHTTTFTPTANYQWSDGSTNAKGVTWTITKAAGSLSLDQPRLTINSRAATGTITVTKAGDGVITAQSDRSDIATVSVSGNTVTVTGKAYGNATITVKVAEGTNHTAPSDMTCSVTVILFNPILNNNTWGEIKQASDLGVGANFWNVGDTKNITIHGTVGHTTFSNLSIDAFILGFNHNSAMEGGNRIHFQIGKINGVQVALCDQYYNNEWASASCFLMNPSSTNVGGWSESSMRKALLGSDRNPTVPTSNTLLAALPYDLRAIMKSVIKYTDNTGGGACLASYVTATTDYLWLLSEFELHGICVRTNSTEQNYQAQYDYYKAGNSKVKYKHNATKEIASWWCRSPTAHPTAFSNVRATNSNDSNNSAGFNSPNRSYGIAPCFCV